MWNTTLKEVLKEVYKRDIKEGGGAARAQKMRTQDLGENLSPNPIQNQKPNLGRCAP